MTTKSATAKIKSDAFAAIHSAAKGLHRVGAVNKTTMREYDALCLDAISEYQRVYRAKMGSGPEKAKWHGAQAIACGRRARA